MGISAVVATVLIILITVASVTIIWAAIIPMINDRSTFDNIDTRLDIVKSSGYTFYDEDDCLLYAQVKRSPDDSNIVGMEIFVTIEGNSEKYEYDSAHVPGPNQAKVIVINLTDSISCPGKPDKIKILPIINDGNIDKPSSVFSELEDIDTGDAINELSPTPVAGGGPGPECSNDGDCPDTTSCSVLDFITNDNYCNVDTCELSSSSTEDCNKGADCMDYFCDSSAGCTNSTSLDGTTCLSNSSEKCASGSCIPKIVSDCYQESANVAEACGALGTGNYSCSSGDCANAVDGIIGTEGSSNFIVYINYTKPINALETSMWNFTHVWDSVNVSIDSDCLTESTLQLKIENYVESNPALFTTFGDCWNGTSWKNIIHLDELYWGGIKEEAMLWKIVE